MHGQGMEALGSPRKKNGGTLAEELGAQVLGVSATGPLRYWVANSNISVGHS
jgi:hypothetical protein